MKSLGETRARARVTVRIFLQRVVSFPPSLIDVDRFALTRAGSE